MELNKQDKDKVIRRYTERYDRFGYDPKTLGWVKGKQNIRFDTLTSQFDLDGKSVLDIGCGFGDLNKFLLNKSINYSYLGIDVVERLINEATQRYSRKDVEFKCGDFLSEDVGQFDYAVGSGIFNFKLDSEDNYTYIERVISKAFSICNAGAAFDFLSDKVDFIKYDYTFHSAPDKILAMCYKYTRNIVLRNDYMPFEFSIFMFKDDSFGKEDTIFNSYKEKKGEAFFG
jgi:SAM-dependent methyltransferase